MPSPDAPSCFAVRRLNPFLGVAEVVDTGSARAISVDGASWQIQIRAEPPGKGWGSLARRSGQKKFFRFGHWTEFDGLVRAPVNPELNISEMLGKSDELINVLQQFAGSVPFTLEDNVELWLLDDDGMPLALLASVVREDLIGSVKVDKWWATMSAEYGFLSPSLEAQGYSNAGGGRKRGHAERLEQQIADVAAGRRWFIRDHEGNGRKLVDPNDGPDVGILLERRCFPEFTLRSDWESDENTAAVDDWIQWSAPRLLTLQNFNDSTRNTLEHAARPNAMLVEEQFRLYPRVINDALMDSARVEARIRLSNVS